MRLLPQKTAGAGGGAHQAEAQQQLLQHRPLLLEGLGQDLRPECPEQVPEERAEHQVLGTERKRLGGLPFRYETTTRVTLLDCCDFQCSGFAQFVQD